MVGSCLLTRCSTSKESPKESKPSLSTEPAKEKESPKPVAKITAEQFGTAALEGNYKVIETAIEAGIDVNTPDPNKRTALMLASFNGHQEIVNKLLEAGAQVKDRDPTGRTALMYASSGPFPDTVALLIKAGSEVNAVDTKENWTALMVAASEGRVKNIEILLASGADPSLKDIDGDTALSFARTQKKEQAVKLLTQK